MRIYLAVYGDVSAIGRVCTYVFLRNLPTHTVNNLLQKLNYVTQFQYSVIKHKFNIINIMCENFRTMSCVLCNIQLIQFERVKLESHKNRI